MNLNIKTMIRLDDDILSALVESCATLKPYGTLVAGEEHWAIAIIPVWTASKKLREVLANNGDCYKRVTNMGSWYSPNWVVKSDGDTYFFGLSLSTYNSTMNDQLTAIGVKTISGHFARGVPRAKGLLLETEYFVIDSEVTITEPMLSEVEQQFVDEIEKLDLFYSFSDSLSVYKAGGRNLNDKIKWGQTTLGLTKGRCDELVTMVYKKYTT